MKEETYNVDTCASSAIVDSGFIAAFLYEFCRIGCLLLLSKLVLNLLLILIRDINPWQ